MPLLEGYTDGVQKMSKSLNNYIGINEPPENMFGKIMSISDDLMWRYYELLSDKALREIQNLRSQVQSGALHPMEAKKALGVELVARYHGAAAADSAHGYFEARHQKKTLPSDIRKQFKAPEPIWICRLLVDLDFAKSGSEARRLIAQGAVRIDSQVVTDVNMHFDGALHRGVAVGKNRIA